MPPIQKKSSVLAKFGPQLNQAVAEHSADPVEYGPVNLPPGINNGVAQLERAYFDVYKTGDNTGKPYFRASGVVIEPAEHAGLRTTVMIGLVDS